VKRSRSSSKQSVRRRVRDCLRAPGVSLMTSTKGTIKRLVVDKGFGFVADHDGGFMSGRVYRMC